LAALKIHSSRGTVQQRYNGDEAEQVDAIYVLRMQEERGWESSDICMYARKGMRKGRKCKGKEWHDKGKVQSLQYKNQKGYVMVHRGGDARWECPRELQDEESET
jgi:hypothetical protein